MKKVYRLTGCLLASLCIAFAYGCGGGSSSNGTGNNSGVHESADRQFGTLVFKLSTTKAIYALGEPVPITFTVTNVGPKTVTLTGEGKPLDFITVSAGATNIWGFDVVVFPEFIQYPIAPGDTKTLEETWPQLTDHRDPVGAGSYFIRAGFDPVAVDGTAVAANEAAQFYANPLLVILR